MDTLIKCPKCNASGNGCDYCDHTGYVLFDGKNYYTVALDDKENPVRDKLIGAAAASSAEKGASSSASMPAIFGDFMPEGEPHDLIWYLKERSKD